MSLLPPHVRFGAGTFATLGELARERGLRHVLVVSDPGIVATGFVDAARRSLEAAGTACDTFHAFSENPDSDMVEAGRRVASAAGIDGLIGLGGGSSMDCAKAINFVLTSGGTMADYRGYGKASRPMLPMIAVPTTAGTGSEAQTYALISDPRTHVKMACGDPQAAFAAVVLDPELTVSQPPHVTAAAGYDAIAHAVETWVTMKRNDESDAFSRAAWTLLSGAYERALGTPTDVGARGDMLLGAYYAGAAIERSMLGATHACANPLTARYGTVHGVAIAMLLRHVVRWNSAPPRRLRSSRHDLGDSAPADNHSRSATTSAVASASAATVAARYAELATDMENRLAGFAAAGQFPAGLAAAGVSKDDVESLSEAAAGQWTGTFNPRPLDAAGAREIYEMAW
jgi:alcohol dehydrogenase